MNKIAQRRSVLNKLHEMTNISGAAAEKFFNPQFQEVMDNLRAVDSNIRSIVAGQSLDGGDVGGVDRSLKEILGSAKSKINRREFMTAVAELGRFHSKIKEVMAQIGRLHENVDKVHHQFLFQDLGDEHKQQLGDISQRWASTNESALIKQALGESIGDFLHNVLNDRGRALSFYEKRYPKQVGALRNAAAKMVARSQALLGIVLSSLKEMASARAARNPDKYIQAAKKVEKGFLAYDTSFKEFYNGNVKQYEKFFAAQPKEVPADKAPESVAVVPPGSDPNTPTTSTTIPSPGPGVSTVVPTGEAAPIARTPGAPLGEDLMGYLDQAKTIQNTSPTTPAPAATQSGMQSVEPGKPSTMIGVAPEANPRHGTVPYETQAANNLPPMLSHGKFWESLQSMSGEHPAILSSFIKKYAQGIQGSDPATAVQLLQIAKSIRG